MKMDSMCMDFNQTDILTFQHRKWEYEISSSVYLLIWYRSIFKRKEIVVVQSGVLQTDVLCVILLLSYLIEDYPIVLLIE